MPLLPERGPLRVLATATLVNTFGNGLMYTISALYFTRIVGLSAAEVGVGLSCAGFVALISGIPLGHVADRRGPRETQMLLVVVMAGLSVGYVFIATFWQFAALASLIAFFDAGTRAARGALIARIMPQGQRVYARAYLRSISNIGITLGAGLAGVALHLDTPTAYQALIVVDAATYAATAVVMISLPSVAPIARADSASMTRALRDRPYVAMVAVSGVLAMHFGLIELGMPLWVASHTDAPRSLVAGLFILNTVMVVLFQVRASRNVTTPADGARVMARAGVILFVACALFAVAGGVGRSAAIALLVLAALVHVVGEILQSAGSFCLNIELAPEHAQGQYQGLAGTGMTMSFMFAPSVVAFLPLGMGAPGWVILGAIFLASGFALTPIVRWAERSHSAAAAATVRDDIGSIANAQR